MEPATAAAVYDHVTLPVLSLGEIALVLAVLLPAFAIAGFWSGRANRAKRIAAGKEVDLRAGEASLGAIVGLLGLLLAFSFGGALSLLDSRKTDVITEANALGTAFLRTDYLPEPEASELREAIHAYTLTRIYPRSDGVDTPEDVQAFIQRSLNAQARLWPLTVAATGEPLPPALASFVAASVNDVLDAHALRMRSLSAPVVELSQTIVVIAALAALFILGNRSGIAGRALTWRTFVFSALLFAVMLTVIDVQRATQGLIRVDQSALQAALRDMETRLR